jgi:early secretory antigenic target protein ESAT-6
MELDGLRVVHAGLDRAADELTGVVTAIDARLQRLDEDLQPLRTAWIGDAQQAYAAAKQRWDSAITEMRDLLAQTSRQVGVANAAYRAADVRGARSFDA